jgi:acetyl esterase/lipase
MAQPSPRDTASPVPFDPEIAAAMDALGDVVFPSMALADIPHRREVLQGHSLSDDDLRGRGAFAVEERTVPGPPGGPDVALLICRRTGGDVPRPLVYFVHPGGMVLGTSRSGVDVPLVWARELDMTVVSVEYRLAPEHPHPAPSEDSYAGLEWVAALADEVGMDPERLLLAGISAGGGMAAALALMARDRGGPSLAGQMLLCPMLDDRNDSPSTWQMEGLGLWDRNANATGWAALLGEAHGGPDVSPYAAPARADDLAGLPPAFLDVASAETFRDEVVDYASRLWRAGGRAELHVWPGGCHDFDSLAPEATMSHDARAARMSWLRRVLNER